MKKRKELDALVSNGKSGHRGGGMVKKNGVNGCGGSRTSSAHELLKHDSDSSDIEDFSILQPRKGRKKGGSSLPFSAICLPLCQFVLVTTCILVSGTLIWLHIGLREDLDILRAHLQRVETGNRNTPEELHTVHWKLKDLDSNVSALFVELKKNILVIENATAEIKQLKEITNSLHDSIAAAPAIKQLPKDVKSLSERVVTFGSKIDGLEGSVKELKDGQSSFQSLYDELDSIKTTVHELSNVTKMNATDFQNKLQPIPLVRDQAIQSTIQETKQKVTLMQKEIHDLTNTVDKMNLTVKNGIKPIPELSSKMDNFNNVVLSLLNKTYNQNEKLVSLESYANSNLTTRLENVELECAESSNKPHQYLNRVEILNLVNRTVTDAIVNTINSRVHDGNIPADNASQGLVVNAYNELMLFTGLLKQFNDLPEHQLLSEKNATEIVSLLLQNSSQETMKDHDFRIKSIQEELSKLSSYVSQMQNNKFPPSSSSTVKPSAPMSKRNVPRPLLHSP